MCRCRNAFARAIFAIATSLSVLLLFGAPAAADEPSTPRAAPASRAYPRAFSSYDEVMKFATEVVGDQNALDAKVAPLRAERDTLLAQLASVGADSADADRSSDPDGRGGLSIIAGTSSRIRALQAAEKQLVSAGALTAPPSAWRMPTEGEITQPFGPTDLWFEPSRTFNGVTYAHFHEGVDIAGPWAADVVSPARGRVVFVGMMMDGAEIVVIAHDDGVVTMYAHLDAWNAPPTVAAGDEVAAGQKIGTQGLTGMTTGQHLHWVAWRHGVLIDPMSLVHR